MFTHRSPYPTISVMISSIINNSILLQRNPIEYERKNCYSLKYSFSYHFIITLGESLRLSITFYSYYTESCIVRNENLRSISVRVSIILQTTMKESSPKSVLISDTHQASVIDIELFSYQLNNVILFSHIQLYIHYNCQGVVCINS